MSILADYMKGVQTIRWNQCQICLFKTLPGGVDMPVPPVERRGTG